MTVMLTCLLGDLIRVAAARWRTDLSQRTVAAATGLSPTTINSLVRDSAKRYELHTLELVCGYFGCTTGELLFFGQPDAMLDAAWSAVRRPAAPTAPAPLPIQSRIGAYLQQPPSAGHTLTLDHDPRTVERLVADDVRQIERATLIQLCVAYQCTVSDLLVIAPADLAACATTYAPPSTTG